MKFLCCTAVLSILTTSCATSHYGAGKQSANNMTVSCKDDSLPGAVSFRAVYCSLENTSDNWVTVTVSDLSLVSEAKDIKLSTAEETVDFQTAYAYGQANSDWNTNVALSLVLLGGTVLAGAANNDTIAGLGAGAAIGAAAYGAVRDVSQAYGKVQYPSTHLLSGPIRIPPKMFVRRYALVQQAAQSKSLIKAVRICTRTVDRPEQAAACDEFVNPNGVRNIN